MKSTNNKYQIDLEARKALEALIRSYTTPKSLHDRAGIILGSADGKDAESIAQEIGTTSRTVRRWRKRYFEDGIVDLNDRPRSGQPRKSSPELVEKVLRLTVERLPKEANHWSLRLMAKYADTTPWQVQQIWKDANLKPHRIKTFKISNDPKFAEKVIDVVGLYMNPPDNAMVLSIDEKTQIQALDRTQPMLQLRPGQIERRTHDYKRNGTVSLYAALDVATGEVQGRLTKRHRAKEFIDFMKQVERNVPAGIDLHVILDNSSTHKTEAVNQWLAKHPRIKMHFTPTSASWLNAVESWFSQLERRSLYRGSFTSVPKLKDEIKRYIRVHNQETAKPFRWTKKADSIIAAVARARKSADNIK